MPSAPNSGFTPTDTDISLNEEAPARRHFARRSRGAGSFRTIHDVASQRLGNTRDLYVYLPPDYDTSDARYPVIYFQDGQNLFEPEKSFAGAWGAHEAALTAARLGYDAILVGVPNTGVYRIDEYSPWRDERLGGLVSALSLLVLAGWAAVLRRHRTQ